MSITGALNAALSGLTATSRRAEAVSSNIANASTPGYGRREVQLSSGLLGGLLPGVSVNGVVRKEDLVLLAQRREAQAGLGYAGVGADFLAGLEEAIGLPGEAGSLTERLAAFDAAMIEAASRPDSDARLTTVANRASDVAGHLNRLSAKVQDERLLADQRIASSVDQLNTALAQVLELNGKIVQFNGSTRDATSLVDERQRVIDGIAELIPIRQIARDNGAVALYTEGGAVLVDGKAAEFGFSGVPDLTVYHTQSGGGLSGLTINGQSITTSSDSGPISGGKLSALFNLRDTLAPEVQTKLDAVARDLIERFEDINVDPTLTAGDAGLFTDNGDPLDITEAVGLSGRISLSGLVDPAQGGEVWRLRDGLGAATPGDVGDATLLNAMSEALGADRVPATGGFNSARGAVGLAGDLLSYVSVGAYTAESQVSFARAQTDALLTAEYQDGVDTDQEMQELLLIEQAYAANARVMQTLDTLMNQLLEI